jgi:hypothetical protein
VIKESRRRLKRPIMTNMISSIRKRTCLPDIEIENRESLEFKVAVDEVGEGCAVSVGVIVGFIKTISPEFPPLVSLISKFHEK